jgi:two-component system LytT family response regulator
MSEFKVIIVDDEVPARVLLRKYIEQYPSLRLVATCKNGGEAIEAIEREEPDLVFLDIRMPVKDGFEVLREIRFLPRIIFSTAFDTYALEAFNVNAVDYLLKPYTLTRFDQALQKALRWDNRVNLQELKEKLDMPALPDHILVMEGNRLASLPLMDIIWLEAEGDYTRIHTMKRSYLSNKGITELEQRLGNTQFVRVHRSALISLKSIAQVHKEASGPRIVLVNGREIRVSRSYLPHFRKLIL